MSFKKYKNIILSVGAVIEGYLLFLAQECNVDKTNPQEFPAPFNFELFQSYYGWACENIGKCAFISFIALIVLHIIFEITIKKSDEEWLRKLFKHIIDQDLGGDQYETRMTLYVAKNGGIFTIFYFFYAFIKTIKEFTLRYFRVFPNPLSKLLIPCVRHSYPEKGKSYTFFNAISNEGEKPESVVETCFVTGKVVCVNTAFINDIELPKSKEKLSGLNKTKVEKYMKDTGMKSYNKLRTLQRKANAIYAFPIRKEQKILGVVVVDNNTSTPLDLDAIFRDKIENYQRIIQLTINTL